MKSSNSSKSNSAIRFAEPPDIPLILGFIRDLAEYEHLSDCVQAGEDDLRRHLFQEKRAEVLMCDYQGEPAGFALFFHNFSTFLGKPGIYIEDIFVKPAVRGRGLGTRLFQRIAELAVERQCGRLEWACLNWNEASIGFYQSLGAVPLAEWTTYRLTEAALKGLLP